MRYARVKIRRDTQTTFNRSVPPWELPILEFIFEAGNIEDEGFEDSKVPYPENAGEEFGRLSKAYGEDPDTGIAYAVSVYGNAGRGVKALQSAIDEARRAEEAARPRALASTRKAKTVRVPRRDPLMA